MNQVSLVEQFSATLRDHKTNADNYVPLLVDLILKEARRHRASDVHLTPVEDRLVMQWRIDGVLHTVAGFDAELSPRVIARLKVMAGLLTYRTDVPQEGRVSRSNSQHESEGEIRVTTFPTLYGEKAAVRLFGESDLFQRLSDLELPTDIETSLRSMLHATSGVVLLTGPSGSGKTTTVYACLREIVSMFGETKGVMTLEDPIEVIVSGTTQSQVRPHVGFDLATGLKSMMRQDPDVIMVGEIRDPETAESAFQAALTGHLVLTTFHAGSSVEAVMRLLDLGIEPYLLRSTLRGVVCQRLLRRSCSACGAGEQVLPDFRMSDNSIDNVAGRNGPSSNCSKCGGLNYHGRFVTAELLDPNRPEIASAILARVDAHTLQSIANDSGSVTLRSRAEELVRRGETSQEEVFRVLGSR